MGPAGITIIIGTACPAATRLSRMAPARPTVGHESSLSPPPCSRYKTGYDRLSCSYPGGVYTCMRRRPPVAEERYHTLAMLPCGTPGRYSSNAAPGTSYILFTELSDSLETGLRGSVVCTPSTTNVYRYTPG